MKVILVFFCLLTLIKSNVYNLTDNNFDTIVRNGEKNPWVIMFYIKKCSRCGLGHELLQKYSNTTENVNFGRVECNDNSFTCLRFNQLNVTRMPNLIVVEKNKYFENKGIFEDESVIQSIIKEERTVEKGIKLPPSIGYIDLIIRVIKEVLNIADFLLEEFVNESLGINMKWSRTYSLILLVSIIILIIIIEYLIFIKCLKKKRFFSGSNHHRKNINCHIHNKNDISQKKNA